MANEPLRIAAFCVYLAAWLVLAVAAIAGAIPRRMRQSSAPPRMTPPILAGMLLQGTAALPITLSLGDGPLRPLVLESLGALALAPFGAALFVWALWSVRGHAEGRTLVTGGAYARLRHPMYLAFLAMLIATGLLASGRVTLAVAALLYVAGCELRVAFEEAELEKKFPADYPRYRENTRWRYLPGLR